MVLISDRIWHLRLPRRLLLFCTDSVRVDCTHKLHCAGHHLIHVRKTTGELPLANIRMARNDCLHASIRVIRYLRPLFPGHPHTPARPNVWPLHIQFILTAAAHLLNLCYHTGTDVSSMLRCDVPNKQILSKVAESVHQKTTETSEQQYVQSV